MLIRTKRLLQGLTLGSAITAASLSAPAYADFMDDLMKDASYYGNLRLRYEDVDIDGGTSTDALILRTTLGLKTGTVSGLSATLEVEDVRQVLGFDEEDAANLNAIADTSDAFTEIDQAFVQYKKDSVTARLGRQVITLDDHRHVGHVAWRQDKQTFDAARVTLTPVNDLTLDYSHVWRVNRINSSSRPGEGFTDIRDTSIDLFNASYKTPVGKLVAYYYGLSNDGFYEETETIGASFDGKVKVSDDVAIIFGIEHATQDNKTDNAEPDYSMYELGAVVAGVTAKVTLESIGSDRAGDGDLENFTTPLATIHKFQGWADVFLGGGIGAGAAKIDGGNGIDDLHFTVSTKLAGTKLVAVYHDYDSEAGSNDLGDEINLLAVKKINKRYTVGLKYADYSAGDIGSDTTRYWGWVQVNL